MDEWIEHSYRPRPRNWETQQHNFKVILSALPLLARYFSYNSQENCSLQTLLFASICLPSVLLMSRKPACHYKGLPSLMPTQIIRCHFPRAQPETWVLLWYFHGEHTCWYQTQLCFLVFSAPRLHISLSQAFSFLSQIICQSSVGWSLVDCSPQR